MTLSELYIDLLRTRDPSRGLALANALSASRPLEAHLLERFAREGTGSVVINEGSWHGRTAWIGPQLPKTSEAGQLWFDTIELTAMVSLARPPPEADWAPQAIQRWTPLLGWLSLHPVSVWQYNAYVAMTKGPPLRILRDVEEMAPVTSVTPLEAHDFCRWMSKQLPEAFFWEIVRDKMRDSFDRIWGASVKEWFGWPEPDENEAFALTPQTIDENPYEQEGDVSPDRRMRYACNERSKDITFRTAVFTEVGLNPSQPSWKR